MTEKLEVTLWHTDSEHVKIKAGFVCVHVYAVNMPIEVRVSVQMMLSQDPVTEAVDGCP